jgi:hypothetical protein
VTALLRIRRAVPLPGFVVRLTLTDGATVERDIGGLLMGPVFEPIRRDPTVFGRVRVRHGTLAWPGDVDLDPDVLIWGGPPPRSDARPPATLVVGVPP